MVVPPPTTCETPIFISFYDKEKRLSRDFPSFISVTLWRWRKEGKVMGMQRRSEQPFTSIRSPPETKGPSPIFVPSCLLRAGFLFFFADALTRRRTQKMRQFASLSSFSSGRASYVYLRDSNSLSLSLSILPLWRIEKRHASKRSFSLCLSLSCERRLRPRMPQGGRRSRNERNVWTAKNRTRTHLMRV